MFISIFNAIPKSERQPEIFKVPTGNKLKTLPCSSV